MSKEDRIAALEKRVAELESALKEWRPLAAATVPSDPLDAHRIWREQVNDLRGYSESADWSGTTEWRNQYGYL